MRAHLAGPDRLAEHLARLERLPDDTAHRALVAIAVTHQLNRRGRCQTCARPRSPFWPGRRSSRRSGRRSSHQLSHQSDRGQGDCHTRRILRATLPDGLQPQPPRRNRSGRG